MPNWVFNYVDISGNEADLRAFMDKASRPYTTHHKGDWETDAEGKKTYDPDIVKESVHESVLSFMNFSSPANLDTYFASSTVKPEGYAEMSMQERIAHSMKFDSDGWYDWNVREWGTKWDACDAEITESSDPSNGVLQYKFETAWSPAEGAFRQMVAQHPELDFEFSCEEEQGWGVEFASSDSELVVTKEWEIPNSHADYEERDNPDGCACAYDDDQAEWYDDCPREKEAV
jgi:hypothetical protein